MTSATKPGAITKTPSTERRAYPRFELLPGDELRITVGPLGIKLTQGLVLNISRGGTKVRLEQMVFAKGNETECLLRFLDAGRGIVPHSLIANVLSLGGEKEQRPFATIEFRQPLELLDLTQRRS